MWLRVEGSTGRFSRSLSLNTKQMERKSHRGLWRSQKAKSSGVTNQLQFSSNSLAYPPITSMLCDCSGTYLYLYMALFKAFRSISFLTTSENLLITQRQQATSKASILATYSLKLSRMRYCQSSFKVLNSLQSRHLKKVESSLAMSSDLLVLLKPYQRELLSRQQNSTSSNYSMGLVLQKLLIRPYCSRRVRYSKRLDSCLLVSNFCRSHSTSSGRQRLNCFSGMPKPNFVLLSKPPNIIYNSGINRNAISAVVSALILKQYWLFMNSKSPAQRSKAQEQYNNEPAVPATNLKSMSAAGKNSFLRDLIGLKTLMDKRGEQRGLTLYYLTNNKFQSALIYCRQLTFSSLKIYKEYSDDYNEEFEENFFERTCKAKEHLNYLLDSIVAVKVFLQAKKKEDAIDIFEKVELHENQKERQVVIRNQHDKVRFNEQHEIMSRMCAVLLTFVDIARTEKLYEYSQKFFKVYINYVKLNYGIIEYSTALFKYGAYLHEIKNYQAAEQAFQVCVQIRKKNVVNSCLVDALVNLSVCQRELAEYEQAIANTKDAIQIYKDIKINDEGIDRYYLFLAKVCMEAGSFEDAYANFLKCYKHRLNLRSEDPAKVEIELNLIMFFKVLKDVTEKHKEVLNIEDKKVLEEKKREAVSVYDKMRNTVLEREEFSKYRDFKSSKFSHLSLYITKEFFDALSAYQVIELNGLLKRLGDITYARGLTELGKCSFYEQKKVRDLLIESNVHLKKGILKKSSEAGSSRVGF